MIYRIDNNNSNNNLLIQHYESTLTLINTSTLKKKELTSTTTTLVNPDSSIHPFQQGVLVQNKNSIEELLFNGRHRIIEPLELKADENRSILFSFYGNQQFQLLNVVMCNGELLRISTSTSAAANAYNNNNCEKIMERKSFNSARDNHGKKGYFIDDYDAEEEEESITKVFLKKSSADREDESQLYFLLDNDLIVKKNAESYETIEEYNIPRNDIEDNFMVDDFSVHSYSATTTTNTSSSFGEDELSLDVIIIQSSSSSSNDSYLSVYIPIDEGELLLLSKIIIPSFGVERISYQLHNSLLFLLLPTTASNASRLMVYDLHLDSIIQFYTSSSTDDQFPVLSKPELVSCVEFNCPVESFVVYNDLLKGLVMYYENAISKKVEEYSLDYLLLYKVFIPSNGETADSKDHAEEMEENLLRLSPLQQHFSAFVKKFQSSSDGVEIEFKRLLLLQLKINEESSKEKEESYPHFLRKQEGVYNESLLEMRKVIKQIMSEYLTALQTRKELIKQQLQLSSDLLVGLSDSDSNDSTEALILQKKLEKLLANSERLDKRSTLLLSICMDLMYPLLSDAEQKFKAEIVSFKKRTDRIRNDLVKYRNIIVKYGFTTKEEESLEHNSVHNIPVMMNGLEKNQQFLKKVCAKVKEIEQKMELIE